MVRPLEFWDGDGEGFRRFMASQPKAVQKFVGDDLRRVQCGEVGLHTKSLSGFPVQAAEVAHRTGVRVVFSVAFAPISGKVFIADSFMKDSREGSTMRKADKERIEARLKQHKTKYQKKVKHLH